MTLREEQVFDLARRGFGRWDVERILRALPAIQRSHEAECSWAEDVSDPFVKRGDAAFKRLAAIVSESSKSALVAHEQGDPRGACVQIHERTTDDYAESAEPVLRLGAVGFSSAAFARVDAYAERVARSAPVLP